MPTTEPIDSNVWILRLQDNAAQRGLLTIWTIYDRPDDYPHGHCARRHEVGEAGPKATENLIAGDLEVLRATFRDVGLVCIPRSEGDDKVIVESWI